MYKPKTDLQKIHILRELLEESSFILMELKTFLQIHRFEFTDMQLINKLVKRISDYESLMNENFTPDNIN